MTEISKDIDRRFASRSLWDVREDTGENDKQAKNIAATTGAEADQSMVENTANNGEKSNTVDSFNDGEVPVDKEQDEGQQQRQGITRKRGGRAKRQSGDLLSKLPTTSLLQAALSTKKEQSSRSFSPELNAVKTTPSSNSPAIKASYPKDAREKYLQQQYQQLLQQHEELSDEKAAVLDHVSTCHDKLNVSNKRLLNQKECLVKQLSEMKQKYKQLDCNKTETFKAFGRAKTFMMHQLEKATAENSQAVIEESKRCEELHNINEQLFKTLDKMAAEKTRLILGAGKRNEELLVKIRKLMSRSSQLADQIFDADEQLKIKNESVSKQLKELAGHITYTQMNEFELVKKQNDVCDFNRKSQRRGAEFELDCHESTMDVMEEYTKCCVCLEPYECGVDATSTEKRLPIKSATCAHSLCEECLDGYHASLVADKSNLRYVRCPQCNDKTKKAFDIQNKVIDFFLREYIMMSKSALASKRRVKAKTAPESGNECDKDMPAPNSSISTAEISTERRKMIEKAATVWSITS